MIKQFISTLALAAGISTSAHALPITINMTADNNIAGGGLCSNSSCSNINSWSSLGANTTDFNNWQRASTVNLNLGTGTHHFAWNIQNYGAPSSGNPAGLLAEILWANGTNFSSSNWEIFNINTGSLIEQASEYGSNGGNNIWRNVNGGAINGISTNANWIYTSNNFSNASSNAWIRTSVTIAEVSEPATLAMMGLGLAILGFVRRSHAKTAP